MSNLKNFYFTFGSEGQIYNGGWIIIRAEDEGAAREKFATHYGDDALDKYGFLRFAFSYDEETFNSTSMSVNGNMRKYCHEIID